MSEKIVLIDGHSILNRAFYGLPDLTNAKGFHTNAIYGFLNIMFRILDEEKPDYLTVAFDVKAPTFRHAMFSEYKGTRKPMPEELRQQVPVLKQVLKAMNICIVEQPGLEADDILGTLAKRSEQEGMEVSLISGDRDLLQIASDNIMIRIPKTKMGKTEIENYHTKDVLEKYLVPPLGIIELKALMGDTADNIPGVPKVGEKTATDLIVKYNNLETLYDHLEDITRKSIHDTLAENRELATLSKKLATINIDGEFPYDKNTARLGNFYTRESYELFLDLGFKNLLKRFENDTTETKNKISYVIIHNANELKKITFEKNDVIGVHAEMNDDFIAVAIDRGNQVFYAQSDENLKIEEIQKSMQELVSRTDLKIAVFNAKLFYKMTGCGYSESLFCTKIAAYLLNPLKSDTEEQEVANEYGGFRYPGYKELFPKMNVQKAFTENQNLFMEYLCNCAHGNQSAYAVMQQKLIDEEMEQLFTTIEMPLTKVLFDMEETGVIVKPKELKEYGAHLAEQIKILEDRIYETAGETFNINSPKQLGDVLFEKMGIPSGKKTKTGYSTSAEVLEKLSAEYPFVNDVLEYRGFTKLKSTYADGLASYIGIDGRIHTSFNQTITATGRISSTEPNLQNIPMRTELGRQIRKVFVPADGFVFTDADYSQIELRLMADLSGDEELIEAYRQDADIHRITASKVFHVPFDEVTSLQRRNAKAVNFGIVYGISSFGLSQDLSISKKEAATYIEQYFQTYPKVKSYLESTVSEAKTNGYTTTMFGRRRPMPELKSSNFIQRSFGERVAMNAPIQGTAADIMKIAMIRIHDEIEKKHLKSRLILQVHDEVLVETAKDEIGIIKDLVMDSMMNAAKLKVSLEVDLHTGDDWYEAK